MNTESGTKKNSSPWNLKYSMTAWLYTFTISLTTFSSVNLLCKLRWVVVGNTCRQKIHSYYASHGSSLVARRESHRFTTPPPPLLKWLLWVKFGLCCPSSLITCIWRVHEKLFAVRLKLKRSHAFRGYVRLARADIILFLYVLRTLSSSGIFINCAPKAHKQKVRPKCAEDACKINGKFVRRELENWNENFCFFSCYHFLRNSQHFIPVKNIGESYCGKL